jgi:hypothetical protein
VFEPELPQYRVAFDRVSRRRWYVFGASAVVVVLWGFFAPVGVIERSTPWLLGAIAVAFAWIEVKLFLIFRSDLLARKRTAEQSTD